MSELLTQENIAIFFAAWGGLIGLAQVIVRLTPSTKDDTVVAKIGTFFEGLRNVLTVQKPAAPTKDQQ